MKKKLLVFLFLLISLSFTFSLNGVADYTSTVNYFHNPASVYAYNQSSRFILSAGYSEKGYLTAEFVSNRISFSVDTALGVAEKKEQLYSLKRDVVFNFNGCLGWRDISFGAGIYGGSSMVKRNITNPLYQAFLGKFERLDDSQFINVRFGALYKISQVSFGITADQVLSYDVSNNRMTFEKAKDFISFGTYWAETKYASRGRLKNWVFNAGLEFLNAFNSQERTVSAGGEAILQLTNEYSVSFKTGFDLPLSDIDKTTQNLGFGVRAGLFDVSLKSTIPVSFFSGNKDNIDFDITVSIIK